MAEHLNKEKHRCKLKNYQGHTITKENKHMKTRSVSYVFREMQINTSYHSSFFRMAKLNNTDLFTSWEGWGAAGPSSIAGGNIKCSSWLEDSLTISLITELTKDKPLKSMHTAYDLPILCFGIFFFQRNEKVNLVKNLHADVHIRFLIIVRTWKQPKLPL